MHSIGKRLSKGFIYGLMAQGASYAIGFVLAPIYARALLPEQYGIVSVANSVRGFLLMLMPMGVGGSVVYYYNLRKEDEAATRRTLGDISLLTAIYSAFWFILFLTAGYFIAGESMKDAGIPFFPYGIMVGLGAFMFSFQTVPMSLFVAEEKVGSNALLSTAAGIIQTLMIVFFVVHLRRGANGQIEAVTVAACLLSAVYLFLIFKNAPFHFDMKMFRDITKFSIPLLPHGLFMWILNLSDRAIISSFGKSYMKDLGFYSFGYAIAMVMQGVMAAFNTIWSAVFMSEVSTNEDAKNVLGKAASYAILLLSIFASLMIVFSEEAVTILSGGRYIESARYMPPVILGYFFQGVYMFPGMSIFYMKKNYLFPVITGTSGALNIAINLYGIPRWGVITASWATATGFFVLCLMTFLCGHFRFPLKYRLAPIILSGVFVTSSFYMAYSPHFPIGAKICFASLFALVPGVLFGKEILSLRRS